jgi:hypothetical protein
MTKRHNIGVTMSSATSKSIEEVRFFHFEMFIAVLMFGDIRREYRKRKTLSSTVNQFMRLSADLPEQFGLDRYVKPLVSWSTR